MTSKEKAKELVWKYYHQIEHTMSNEYSDKCWELSKKCALIGVDELLYEYPSHAPKNSYELERHIYLSEFKQEIEAL